jgi:hypothetical protein
MAKFIFEGNDGKQHEVKLDTVNIEELNKNDIVIAKYEIGMSASPKDAAEILQRLNDVIKGFFPDNRVLALATRNGIEDVDIKIVKEQ